MINTKAAEILQIKPNFVVQIGLKLLLGVNVNNRLLKFR